MMSTSLAPYRRLTHRVVPGAFTPRPGDRALLGRVREQEASLGNVATGDLGEQFSRIRTEIEAGAAALELDVVARTFALVSEAIRRRLGFHLYDVQLLAGLALSTGAVAEMKTGEGKTLVAALPAALWGLTGQGVHVATVNDYLARRDFEQMRVPLESLGLTVGLSAPSLHVRQKRRAYACDITYSTGCELGFDFLRDQVTLRSRRRPQLGERLREGLQGKDHHTPELIQRGHSLAIIDEVDSVLIDEANSPLILSGQGDRAATETTFRRAAELAAQLVNDHDFVHDRRRRTLWLTARGHRSIYANPSRIPSAGLLRPWSVYVEQALRAELIFHRDRNYVVRDRKIQLIDQYTGRIFADRHWRDGLHQAVEQKERVPITPEQHTIASVSRQRYFGLYQRLCGMSGTCTGHEAELRDFYGLAVVVIPERIPTRLRSYPTLYFATTESKWRAILHQIVSRRQTGQPILVGSRTVEESRGISDLLTRHGLDHQLLNGAQDEDEAAIIAAAGSPGALTIATNMAGRGTDIALDPAVIPCGGLHVIATERQESARVDRQLAGRAARQGEPGSYQCFVSAEDDLLQEHGPAVAERIVDWCANRQTAGGNRKFDRLLDRVQRRAERESFRMRCELFQQDDWMRDILTTMADSVSAVTPPICSNPVSPLA